MTLVTWIDSKLISVPICPVPWQTHLPQPSFQSLHLPPLTRTRLLTLQASLVESCWWWACRRSSSSSTNSASPRTATTTPFEAVVLFRPFGPTSLDQPLPNRNFREPCPLSTHSHTHYDKLKQCFQAGFPDLCCRATRGFGLSLRCCCHLYVCRHPCMPVCIIFTLQSTSRTKQIPSDMAVESRA